MTTLREAAQQALEALARYDGCLTHFHERVDHSHVITALRAALAEPVQEPVAYRFQSPATEEWLLGLEPPVGSKWEVEPLYTAPPQRKPLRTVIYACPICAASLERQE
jgi:hypothetical protein